MMIFTLLCIVFFFSLDYLMIETKDKNEDQIANKFEQRRYGFMNFA